MSKLLRSIAAISIGTLLVIASLLFCIPFWALQICAALFVIVGKHADKFGYAIERFLQTVHRRCVRPILEFAERLLQD